MLHKVLMLFIFSSLLTSTAYGQVIEIYGNYSITPKIYLNDGVPEGILIDILDYIDNKMDVSFNVTLYPWMRAYSLAQKGGGGIVGLSKTKERLDLFDYSDVLFYDEVHMVVLKKNIFEYNSLNDLKGKVVGHNRGGIYGEEFELGKKEYFTLLEDNGIISRLKMLYAERIDVAFISVAGRGFKDLLNSDSFLKEHEDEFTIIENPFTHDPNYLGFSKDMNMTEFLVEFNEVLRLGIDSGDIDEIINRY